MAQCIQCGGWYGLDLADCPACGPLPAYTPLFERVEHLEYLARIEREGARVRLAYERRRGREHRNRQRRQGPYPVDRPISDPETVVSHKQLAVLLMQKLTIREQAVVDLITREDFTLEDCGTRLGISRGRVQQIREKAFRKMRYAAERQLKLKPEDIFA